MILQARDIKLQFGSTAILNSVSVSLGEGELLGLIGPNGAGKTSLLRVLANLQKPDQGELLFDDKTTQQIKRRDLAQLIGYLAQGAPAHWPLKVKRLVELGRLPHLSPWSTLSVNDHRSVATAMAQAEVTHLADRVVSTLSGGERLRVLLARLFATEPTVILADEPIAALDPYHQLHTMELLKQHCLRGGSAVAVLHDLNMAAQFCDRLVLMDQGDIALEGSVADVVQDPTLGEVYGIEVERIDSEYGFVLLPRQRVKSQ